MAHGIHLKDLELKLLANRGTSISHCPDSNTCLKSGLCDVKKLIQHGIKVGLGTGETSTIFKFCLKNEIVFILISQKIFGLFSSFRMRCTLCANTDFQLLSFVTSLVSWVFKHTVGNKCNSSSVRVVFIFYSGDLRILIFQYQGRQCCN